MRQQIEEENWEGSSQHGLIKLDAGITVSAGACADATFQLPTTICLFEIKITLLVLETGWIMKISSRYRGSQARVRVKGFLESTEGKTKNMLIDPTKKLRIKAQT
ncbi:hypothetical protein M0802_013867 [Mischocyttarus mexicanus]|nr:hypothetical protein M0802_013867 [Mischocyttarus mexicanus]